VFFPAILLAGDGERLTDIFAVHTFIFDEVFYTFGFTLCSDSLCGVF
jgi:hypothetical protein